MKEYVVIPASIVAKPKELAAWIERGHRYAATLPAKGAKKSTTAKKAAVKRTSASGSATKKSR
jgi:hypothetical protein